MVASRARVGLRGLVLLPALVLGAGACTSPKSGIFEQHWCVAESSMFEVVDDMEDGDSQNCNDTGNWYVTHGDGGGNVMPPPADQIKPTPLSLDDFAARSPSQRAQSLKGDTFSDGEWATLGVSFATRDLTPFDEIRFWARSNAETLEIRVAVGTTTTVDSTVHWGQPVMLSSSWTQVSFALDASGDGLVPDSDKNLGGAQKIEFQFRKGPASPTAFDFIIDDVLLKYR